MRNLLLQLDSSRLPSVFDRVVAYDAGADEIMSYGSVTEADVRDLVYGCMFTRGPRDLDHSAVWIGGADMSAGEKLLEAARKTIFPPFTVSMMLDSNGSNTTAVAAVVKIEESLGDVKGRKALVTAGTGPVGLRVAGLLARDGARVWITSRKPEDGERARGLIQQRFGVEVQAMVMREPAQLEACLNEKEMLINCGPAGVQLVPTSAWTGRPKLKIAVDLNAVPPLGIEGIDVNDAGARREGVIVYGALGVGNLKTKLHKACITRMFERNDLVLDAETIADVARELVAAKS